MEGARSAISASSESARPSGLADRYSSSVRPRTNDWLCPPLAFVAPAGRPTDLRLASLTYYSPDGTQYVKSQQDNAPRGRCRVYGNKFHQWLAACTSDAASEARFSINASMPSATSSARMITLSRECLGDGYSPADEAHHGLWPAQSGADARGRRRGFSRAVSRYSAGS